MKIDYRRLLPEDVSIFVRMRIRQLREEGAAEDIDLVPALTDYYKRHMADGTFVSWLALDGDKIVGTSGMSFVENPRTSDARTAGSGFCQVCLRIRNTAAAELQKSF